MLKKIAFPLIIIISFPAYYLILNTVFSSMTEKGLFGDMFGGINALFSGLAFLGVIYAIILQKQELKLQRKELELTRKELKRTAEAQEKSEEALCKQIESMEKTAKLNGLNALLNHADKYNESRKMGKSYISSLIGEIDTEDLEKEIKNLIGKK